MRHRAKVPVLEDGTIPWDDGERYKRGYVDGVWTVTELPCTWIDPEPFVETLVFREMVNVRNGVSVVMTRYTGGTARMAWTQFAPLIPKLLCGEVFGMWLPYKSGDKYLVKPVSNDE